MLTIRTARPATWWAARCWCCSAAVQSRRVTGRSRRWRRPSRWGRGSPSLRPRRSSRLHKQRRMLGETDIHIPPSNDRLVRLSIQPASELAKKSQNQSASHSVSRAATQPASQRASQLVSQSTSQPASQPASQPTSRSPIHSLWLRAQ